MATHVLDLLGYVCPVPLIKTREKFCSLSSGDALSVETEHARAVRNILDWAAREGYPVEVDEVDDGIWQVIIQKP